MIILDASAAVELLLRTAAGRRVARRIAMRNQTLHAPHLLDLEIAQVLRRYDATGVLDSARAEEAMADFADLDIARYSHDVFLPRVWALRHNVTAYDAVYLALSEALGAPLLTTDARLASAAGHEAHVEVVT